MALLIINGKLVTEEGIREESLRIEGERILEIGDLTPRPDEEVIDAGGAWVIPGGIDPHTHMELQQSEAFRSADDFYTGTVAAALGGTTTIIDHIGFAPAGSPLSHSLDRYREKAQKAAIDYSFHGVIQHVDDEILAELERLVGEGIASFKAYSTYGFKVGDGDLLRLLRVMKKAGGLLTVHCENDEITNLLKKELLASGETDAINHARSRPPRTESEFIGRLCELSGMAGNAPIYVVHTSTGLGARRMVQFRREGIPVYMETCPQYLLLSEERYHQDGNEEGVKYIMAPPLRPDADRQDLWTAVIDGSCQTIGTDHCPFCLAEKRMGLDDFSKAPGGAPGVQERMALLFTEGVLRRRIPMERFVELTATNVAKILGLYPHKGTLRPGSDADIVILREGPAQVIRAETQASVSDYSIYEGMTHRAVFDRVISRGEVIVKDGKFIGERGRGKFLPRYIDHTLAEQILEEA